MCFEELDRYVELELTGQDAEAIIPGPRAHLDGCPACREEQESGSGAMRTGTSVSSPSSAAERAEKRARAATAASAEDDHPRAFLPCDRGEALRHVA
jgi:hypothetical protein